MLGLNKMKAYLQGKIIETPYGYRRYLRKTLALSFPLKTPEVSWDNSVLKNNAGLEKALSEIKVIGLNSHNDIPKNWDSLGALGFILKNVPKTGKIFDAGAEIYSVILPWLFLYGYRSLFGGNLIFDKKIKRGSINYAYCDLTNSNFESNFFDAVTCLSVIEHGVDMEIYFKEMSRIIKPGGYLITSTDYYDPKIYTTGLSAYNAPVIIFSKSEIEQVLIIAQKNGFNLTSSLDLRAEEKLVKWETFGLEFTFILFILQKE